MVLCESWPVTSGCLLIRRLFGEVAAQTQASLRGGPTERKGGTSECARLPRVAPSLLIERSVAASAGGHRVVPVGAAG